MDQDQHFLNIWPLKKYTNSELYKQCDKLKGKNVIY